MKNKAAIPLPESRGNEAPASQGYWPEVLAALNTNNYERVSDLLRVIDATARIADRTGLIQIALQICLACIHCHTEAQRHRQAYREVEEREHELRQGLETILATIISASGRQEPNLKREPPRDLLSYPSQIQLTPELGMNRPIWKRLRSFLRLQREQVSTTDNKNLLPSPKKEGRPDQIVAEVKPVTTGEIHAIQEDTPLLVIYCLGTFRVYQDEQSIEDWPSSKGRSIFKYLLTHRERPVAKEVLMDIFWPDADVDSARNNLNVAIYGLRQALRNNMSDVSHVLFQNDSYQLNPKLRYWIDYESFMKSILAARSLERQGELMNSIREFTSAEALYQGEFLEEDRYEDWLLPQRQRLQDEYLKLLDSLTLIYYKQNDFINCANLCLKMLAIDPCREEAHRLLMRCYSSQGQTYLALRQYHICFEALKNELDIVPSKATRELYEMIQRHNRAG